MVISVTCGHARSGTKCSAKVRVREASEEGDWVGGRKRTKLGQLRQTVVSEE
jgi:hypothetical protein